MLNFQKKIYIFFQISVREKVSVLVVTFFAKKCAFSEILRANS